LVELDQSYPLLAPDLRELYALVRRYRMDLEPLEPLNQPRPERLKNLSAASQSR